MVWNDELHAYVHGRDLFFIFYSRLLVELIHRHFPLLSLHLSTTLGFSLLFGISYVNLFLELVTRFRVLHEKKNEF